MAKQAGFADPRLVEDRPLTIENSEVEQKVGDIKFYSATYRLFKLDKLEPTREDYGQTVRYLGTIDNNADRFVLDKHNIIETGQVFPVCGNTYNMLKHSRFANHFEFSENTATHHGVFFGE